MGMQNDDRMHDKRARALVTDNADDGRPPCCTICQDELRTMDPQVGLDALLTQSSLACAVVISVANLCDCRQLSHAMIGPQATMRRFACGHAFCVECIRQWFMKTCECQPLLCVHPQRSVIFVYGTLVGLMVAIMQMVTGCGVPTVGTNTQRCATG